MAKIKLFMVTHHSTTQPPHLITLHLCILTLTLYLQCQVDEIHTVGDETRGACLEACMCRMKTIRTRPSLPSSLPPSLPPSIHPSICPLIPYPCWYA